MVVLDEAVDDEKGSLEGTITFIIVPVQVGLYMYDSMFFLVFLLLKQTFGMCIYPGPQHLM